MITKNQRRKRKEIGTQIDQDKRNENENGK